MRIRYAALALIVTFLVAGGAIGAIWGMHVAHIVWMAATVLMGAPLVLRTLWNMAHGHFATDIVASMSIVGAVWLDQPLAGLVVVLMQTGGEALERYAEGRASAAVRDLEAAAPRVAHIMERGAVRDVAATTVAIGDTLLVRPGDLVPCDGTIIDGESELDTSSLTGEAIPTRASAGVSVMSGMLNGLGSFTMSVSALAAKSQYARIVELVRTAQSSKAPLQRLADKYAVWFTPFTIVMCAAAVLITHDWVRALAILVVATPCPLILATPVAIIGGINRAAKRFVIVRNGGALEQLAKVDAAVFDKTGTITVGQPRVSSVRVPAGFDEKTVMGLAAAVEQHSSHLLARVLVDRVTADGKALATSISNVETPGQGVTGVVDGRVVRVGARAFVVPECDDGVLTAAALERDGATLRAYISVDGRLPGVVEYADEIRSDLLDVLKELTAAGVKRVALLSGDHGPIARAFAAKAGIVEAHGDLLPGDKAQFIELMRAEGHVVMMVGDGVNDAPALSTANVGIAMAAHGGGITAEAADVIVLDDSLDRVPQAMAIGRRTMHIARQSILAGLGLSIVAMIVASLGWLPPVAGAVIQEVIDVAVILNALRSSMEPPSALPPVAEETGRIIREATAREVRRGPPVAA